MTIHNTQLFAERNSAGLAAALPKLKERFGDRYADTEALRTQHAQQTTWLPHQAPDAVVFALSTEDVSDVVRVCNEHKVPVIAYGVGSSLEGHVNAPNGGVSVDLSRMNNIVAVHPEDLDVVVQAGVTRKQVNDYLRDQGLFFPIDPGADATLGGMAATRASGTNAVRYGTMRDNVLNLTAVMPDGTIVKTGGRAKKSAAGYDLARLLIGSEGTLGIITEVTLRLHGIPEAIAAAVVAFEDLESACNTTILTIQSGIPVARIELLDPLAIRAANNYSKMTLPEKPTLFVEFHGSEDSVRHQSESFGEIAREFGGSDFAWATKPEDRTRLWQARHDAYWASQTLRPGGKVVSTDACVPISRLAECVTETVADVEREGIVAPVVGHVGDGNFHLTILVDDANADEVSRVKALISRLAVRAIEMEGTCTGEHGIGQGKRSYLVRELGTGIEVMKAIKHALDPNGIMNPGKIFEDA